MGLRKRYETEIEGWDWNALREDARRNGANDDDDGNVIESTYIGSIFNLTPSGKMYACFATGNLDACPDCNGTGQSRRSWARVRYQTAQARCDVLRHTRSDFAFWLTGKGRETIRAQNRIFRTIGSGTCPSCNGYGSQEAYRDEVWQAALETVADRHGAFVHGSDGDGCSIFVGWPVDAPEGTEDDG